MAVLTKEEFFSRINERLANDNSDEAITFLEDMTDTYQDLINRVNNSGEDWERKYHELDESWKRKYQHRFFHGGDYPMYDKTEKTESEEVYSPERVTIEDLFIKEEK